MNAGGRDWAHPLAIGLVGALAMFGIGFRHGRPRASPATAGELRVTRAEAPITIDGEPDERDWTRAPARTGAFVGPDGAAARPVSEARVLWDDTNLYFTLYAADEDIRVAKVEADGPVWMGDSFHLELRNPDGARHALYVGPTGTLTDATTTPGAQIDYEWQSGAKAAVDVDGTPDNPSDRDEEWAVELAIPFRTLGVVPRRGLRLGLSMKRCDVVERRRICGTWSKDLVLE